MRDIFYSWKNLNDIFSIAGGSHLHAGDIVGIVFGALLGVAVLIIAGLFAVKRYKIIPDNNSVPFVSFNNPLYGADEKA